MRLGLNLWGQGRASTALQRILALSPSALYWPANGAGWQGTSGGTLSASGQPVGLLPDLSQLGGKTQAEWLAAPATAQLWNTPTLVGSSWSFSGGTLTGLGVASGTATGDAVVAGRVYVVSFTVTATGSGLFQVHVGTTFLATLTGGVAATYTYVVSAAATTGLQFTSSGSTTGVITNITCRELPGNHLRAGTWASPSDAARGTFQNNAINFDGSSDYYSLLNAISITTDMTVVRAFKRASAGIRSIGAAVAAANSPYDTNWNTSNNIFAGLSGSGLTLESGNTATGSFVTTAARNGSQHYGRLNGTQLATAASAAASSAIDNIGRLNTVYNSGEISFLAVFPSELTGANLALVEQIAAATNGATLA